MKRTLYIAPEGYVYYKLIDGKPFWAQQLSLSKYDSIENYTLIKVEDIPND